MTPFSSGPHRWQIWPSSEAPCNSSSAANPSSNWNISGHRDAARRAVFMANPNLIEDKHRAKLVLVRQPCKGGLKSVRQKRGIIHYRPTMLLEDFKQDCRRQCADLGMFTGDDKEFRARFMRVFALLVISWKSLGKCRQFRTAFPWVLWENLH